MPWKEITVMSQKQTFVAAAIQKETSFSALCEDYGISRKTGYKWLSRYLSGEDLADKSRRPHVCSGRTSPEIEDLILNERAKHPTWGPRKLKRSLEKAIDGLSSLLQDEAKTEESGNEFQH